MKIFLIFILNFYVINCNPVKKESPFENDKLIYNPKVSNEHFNSSILENFDKQFITDADFVKEISNLFVEFLKHPTINWINQVKVEWDSFKNNFRKIYKNVKEEAKRFLIFFRNYLNIKHHNLKFESGKVKFRMAINHLSDYTDAEYSSLLGLKFKKPKSGPIYLPTMSKVELPKIVDWRSTAVTPIKDQGNCGSCWAFSSTGALEGQTYRKTKKLVSLSEQQLVDCSLENSGCDGGLMDLAFGYISDNGGIDTEQSYPYVSGKTSRRSDKCYFNITNVGATDYGFIDIPKGNETMLKEAVALVGPISVGIDASQIGFRNYQSGVYEDIKCSSEELDHGVLVVGYGVDQDSDIPYWLVKNSWNTTWGDLGYIRMRRDFNNMCGIATAASFPLV